MSLITTEPTPTSSHRPVKDLSTARFQTQSQREVSHAELLVQAISLASFDDLVAAIRKIGVEEMLAALCAAEAEQY